MALSVRLNRSRPVLLPLVVTSRRAESPWPYGGFVSPTPVAEDEARWILRWAQDILGPLRLRSNPFAPHPVLPLAKAPLSRQVARPTHVLALGQLAALRLGYHPSRRLSSQLWSTLDVRVDVYPCAPQHWLDLVVQAAGAPRDSWALWWEAARPHLWLAVARRHGEWVGFAPFSLLGDVAQWHGGWARQGDPDITTALVEGALQHAEAAQTRWWDFGPSPAAAELALSFGATPWPRHSLRASLPRCAPCGQEVMSG